MLSSSDGSENSHSYGWKMCGGDRDKYSNLNFLGEEGRID